MNARYATEDEITRWDKLITANPDGGNIFSSLEYAEIKRLTHYIPHFLIVGATAVTVLEKKTPPLGKLWYLPKGPNVTTTKHLFDILAAIKPLARKAGVFAIRIEPELDRGSCSTVERHGLKKAAPIIPNPSTITLDISQSLDDILMALPQKGRHAIRRAERDGVTVEQVKATDTNCRAMYALLSETAEGQFGIRSYNY
ncbi:MAG TPA: hypothetical protein VN081_06455, partial [Dongiaceae bacterium]|nr:hypothetical protein [Dongiaceae bacterium]